MKEVSKNVNVFATETNLFFTLSVGSKVNGNSNQNNVFKNDVEQVTGTTPKNHFVKICVAKGCYRRTIKKELNKTVAQGCDDLQFLKLKNKGHN